MNKFNVDFKKHIIANRPSYLRFLAKEAGVP